MHDFTTIRFDSRLLVRDDDGSAFEQFVDEYLRLLNPGDPLVRGLVKGRDGAIDLSDASGEVTQIVECKFIGAATEGTAEKRWAEVERHLRDNLPKAAAGKGAEKYRPWLKSQGRLQKYRFATSAICSGTDERTRLRRRITDFFADLSTQHGEFSHLKDVAVEPVYWDDIVGHASKLPPLFYRWFGGFPPGYGEIAVGFGQLETGFKRFLESRMLPYFSREDYNAATGRAAPRLFETSLQHLTTGQEARALVISGAGGIGKTRLSIEICERARAEGWWPVKLERKAKVEDLDRICASHADTGKILLFIDYAEAFAELDQLPEAVSRLVSGAGHSIAVLASTRSSAVQRVTDRIGEMGLSELALDADTGDAGYNAWVVRRIIDHFSIPNADGVAQSCGELPVLAAFAAFLFNRDRQQFHAQFGNLAGVPDFSTWVNRRLVLIEEKFPQERSKVQRLLAELAVQLPMPEGDVDAFCAAADLNRDLVDILRADHWLEPDVQGLSAAHDVLADAMLARYLFGTPGIAQDRLRALLVQALDHGGLDRCMAAIDRLAGLSAFQALSGQRAVEALMRHDEKAALAQFPLLVQSRLVKPHDVIGLLAGSPALRERMAEAPETHLVLARTAEWAATKGRETVDRAEAEAALAGPLVAAVDSPRLSNIVLRCAHAFDPAGFQAAVLDRLVREPVDPDSHYLIVSLLKYGAPCEMVLPHLRAWAAKNAKVSKASFVYQGWLDAEGDIGVVRDSVVDWLGEHASKEEAQFVYRSWLDAKGEVELVRAPVIDWLREHSGAETQFVYKSWLDAGGELETVRPHIAEWLKKHAGTMEAQFVFTSWLNAGGEIEHVRSQVVDWLKTHATADTQFMYKSWLDAKGDIGVVRGHIVDWLGEHATKEEARFVYQSWLDAGGELDVVRNCIAAWLDRNATTEKAQFVYTSWLDAKGEVELVRDHLVGWLDEHATKEDAQFVYTSWLNASLSLHPIQTYCELWIRDHWDKEVAVFVTKSLSKMRDLPRDIGVLIVMWAGVHAAHDDAIYRLSRVSRNFEHYDMTLRFRRIIDLSSEAVVRRLLAKPVLNDDERFACSSLFVNLAGISFARDGYWINVLELFVAAIRHGGALASFNRLSTSRWVLLLHDALAAGLLDAAQDRAAIALVLEAIRTDMVDDEFTHLIDSGYLGVKPNLPPQ